jgi:DNA-binding LacI/PurR family transcriptional regulator
LRRDEVHAGEVAAQALLDLGYQELLCVYGPLTKGAHYSFEQRLKGIRQVATASGIELQEFVPSHKEHMAELLPHLRPDVGVIALDTYLLNGLMFFFAEAGVRPGTDFALVCCDDDFQDVPYRCAASRVSFDRFDMGRQAAQMMLQLLQSPKEPCPSRLLRGTLQPGNTTPPQPTLEGSS